MPEITVLVATYRGAYLRETLDSIRAQTFTDFEVLVLDDAADDDTCRDLVRSYDDTRLIYRRNASNLGPALNHASGIEAASGRFIAILNHDDLWEPDVLAKLLEPMHRDPTVVAAFSRARVATADGAYSPGLTTTAWETWDEERFPLGKIPDWFSVNTRRVGFPIVPTALFRASVARSIRIPKAVGGSYDNWLSYRLARTGPLFHVPDAIGYWREHPDNLSTMRSARLTLQGIYTDCRIAADRVVPGARRAAALKRLPRAVVVMARDAARGTRRVSR